MQAIVSKEMSFCAAHRLFNHPGKCNNLHGHTYKVKISIVGEEIDNKTGMVIDFGTLKSKLKTTTDHLDHSVILNRVDPLAELLVENFGNMNINVLDREPTAENIACHIGEIISAENLLPAGLRVGIVVMESDTTSAGVQACI